MKTVKTLIYGPKESGKTSIIRKTVYRDSVDQLKKIPPTVLIQHVRDYKYGQFNCSFFDCGGQLKFFDRYNDDLADNVFRKVTIFFFVVDSRLYFEEELQNEHQAGRTEEDALYITRQRYTKVAQREFWRALKNLYHFSGETLKLIVLLAHKKDLPHALGEDHVKQVITAKPEPDLVEDINKIYEDVKDIAASMPAFATSIQDATESTGLSSVEKVVFSFLDKLSEVMGTDTQGMQIKRDEIFGILQNANSKYGFVGSLLINIEDPSLSVYAFRETDSDVLRGQVWQLVTTSQGILALFGDKSASQSVFLVGERFFVNVLRLSEENHLIVAFPTQVESLEQKFQQIYVSGQEIKKIL